MTIYNQIQICLLFLLLLASCHHPDTCHPLRFNAQKDNVAPGVFHLSAGTALSTEPGEPELLQKNSEAGKEPDTTEQETEIALLKKKGRLTSLYLLLVSCIALMAVIIAFLVWRSGKQSKKSLLFLSGLNTRLNTENALLERSVKLLGVSQILSKTAGWEYDLSTDEIFLTNQGSQIYDLENDTVITLKKFRALLKDKDKKILDTIMVGNLKQKQQIRIEAEIITKKNEKKWVRIIADPLIKDNEVVGSIGAIQDITLEKQAEKRQQDLTAHLQALITSMEDIVIEVDGNKVYKNVWANDEKLLFLPKDKLIGKTVAEIFGPLEKAFSKPVDEALSTGATTEIKYQHLDPSINKWYKAKVTLINKADDPAQSRLVISVQDITLSAMQDMALKETKENLEQSNMAKDRIMQVLVHDLRSPLSGIHSVSGILLKKNNYSPADLEMLRVINDTSSFLFEMVNDLVGPSLITENEALRKEKTDLHPLVQQSVAVLQFKANEKRQQIHIQIEDSTYAMVDAQKFQRVLSNLINNAIKFSPENTMIRIGINSQDQRLLLSIQDQGIGIPAELKDKVFDVFTTAKRFGTNNEQPFGLGLSISKQIIEAHKGKIWFDSVPDEGTTFFIEIPRT